MSVQPINTVKPVILPTQQEMRPDKSLQEKPVPENNEPTKSEPQVSREDVVILADVLNQVAESFNHQLKFQIFEDTNRLYVQIVDKTTKEVIKQIPPEEMLELSAKIKEMVGLLLDKYV